MFDREILGGLTFKGGGDKFVGSPSNQPKSNKASFWWGQKITKVILDKVKITKAQPILPWIKI